MVIGIGRGENAIVYTERARKANPAHVALKSLVGGYANSSFSRAKPVDASTTPYAHDRTTRFTGAIDPLEREFDLVAGNIHVTGNRNLHQPGPTYTLEATFPDATKVGVKLTGDPQTTSTLAYGVYDGENLVEWSPTPPTGIFFADRLNAAFRIDLRPPKYSELRIRRHWQKVAADNITAEVEARRDAGFLNGNFAAHLSRQGFTVYDDHHRQIAESITVSGPDGLMHTRYTLADYDDSGAIISKLVVTNVGERSRRVVASFARPGKSLEPVAWEKLSGTDKRRARKIHQ